MLAMIFLLLIGVKSERASVRHPHCHREMFIQGLGRVVRGRPWWPHKPRIVRPLRKESAWAKSSS